METFGIQTSTELRHEIRQAWRRAIMYGLDPAAEVAETKIFDVDRESRLMLAARPVMDDFSEHLADQPYCVMLADRDSRIIERRCSDGRLMGLLDRVLAVPGHRYSEETTGTNALATAFEVRNAISVSGEEHFLESFKDFSCYAEPILHPITSHLEGVLDITGFASDASPFFKPYLAMAVRAIEQRLEFGSSLAHRHMMTAFRERAVRTKHPVMVFGEDLTLSNAAASQRFGPSDQLVLRESGLSIVDGRRRAATLTGGEVVELRSCRVEGTYAVLVEVLPPDRPVRVGSGLRTRPPKIAADLPRKLERWRQTRTRVFIHGEPGTGRSYTASELAGDCGVRFVDATNLEALTTFLSTDEPQSLLAVEHVHLLTAAAAVQLGGMLDQSARWYVLTSAVPITELAAEQRAVAARCPTQAELPPLRARRAEIPRISAALLEGLRPGAGLRLTAEALRMLMNWDWPGNVRELSTVLESAVANRTAGDIGVHDLPDIGGSRGRARTPLERAELDAIHMALERANGNKSKAAAELGIGRTTLYRRMKELRINA